MTQKEAMMMNESTDQNTAAEGEQPNRPTLLDCPFCGGVGQGIDVRTSDMWTGTRSVVVSATVIHWCPREEGQPQTCIQVKGKTEADAIRKWNTRAV